MRAFRQEGPDGPEMDVDFVIHGSAAGGTAGPAATWAQTCAVGDTVALLDEGIMFTPDDPAAHMLLVADETAVPAAAGILASLPADAHGTCWLEVPRAEDRQELSHPPGFDVRWIVRSATSDVPGRAALAAATAEPVPPSPVFAWAAGEQSLAAGMRRHWVTEGVPKSQIRFCGYWKAGPHG